MTHSIAFVSVQDFTSPGGLKRDSGVTSGLKTRRGRRWQSLPGAESVLSHPLLLQQTGVLQFDRAGDEAHLAALLHQTPDPPVVVVLLHSQGPSVRLLVKTSKQTISAVLYTFFVDKHH